ncbi:outer membrane protein assembly factor BamE domain-containing protein [Pararhodobacter oceanensis]|uniref:outer membrane protein assembly factor BamE domain-containing protein n=1 Tax=Pararhodobacter oceanensis TaxID=2172121 RepID=UPI003A8CC06A
MKRHFAVPGTLLAIAILATLPLGTTAAQVGNPVHQVDPNAGFTSVSREYPDLNAPYSREGVERDIARIRSVTPGMSRLDVQQILGQPVTQHTDGSMEFHLSLSLTGRDRLICQYRVFFDDEGAVERAAWRRPQCADLVWAQ